MDTWKYRVCRLNTIKQEFSLGHDTVYDVLYRGTMTSSSSWPLLFRVDSVLLRSAFTYWVGYIYAFLKLCESLIFSLLLSQPILTCQFALLTFQVNNYLLEYHPIISTLRLPFHWIKMPCLPFTSTSSSPSNAPKSYPSIMLHAPPGNIHAAKKLLSILILK